MRQILPQSLRRPSFKALLHRAAFLGAVWVALTAPDAEGLALGLLAVPAAVALSLRLVPPGHPLALWRLALHLPRFAAGSVGGGLDVARRAFARDPRLRPGWVAVPVDLPAGARAALGGEVALMPGTLCAGSEGERLLIHLLDTEAGFDRSIPREAAEFAAIVGAPRGAGGRA